MTFQLRAFRPDDADEVTQVAVVAFAEFDDSHGEWPTPARFATRVRELAEVGEMIVATVDGRIAGCVTYVAPGVPKQEWFEPSWPVIRMLAVRPDYRGRGVGRALTEECIRRARRDGATMIALHTSPVLEVAFALYDRMGFEFMKDAPPRGGAPYGVYVKRFGAGE